MSVQTPLASEGRPPLGLLETHVESFLNHLRSTGYAERTVRKKRPIAVSFVRWTWRKKLQVRNLRESHVAAFTGRSPRKRKARRKSELAILRLFLGYLRLANVVQTPTVQFDVSPGVEIQQRYVDYLRNERGLAENSILVYSPYVHDFLDALVAKTGSADPERLDARIIQDFVLDRVRGRSSEYSRLLATALRSFLRFLYLREETLVDFSLSIPMFRKGCPAALPMVLSPEEVERVLAATNRSTPCGRRDYAILLLLARLGLRAGEVVLLELGDIHWRTGEITVRGKGRMLDRLPLLAEIGKALAIYIRKDRHRCASRRIFLRMWAPPIELAGPGAVSHIVRSALARAAVRRTGRGAAHLFRHSLAAKMIRHGASIAQISEVLRHRSQTSTEIYARVDFETLRGVARPWPGTGGVQ